MNTNNSSPPFYRHPLFIFKMVVYVGTGILQPLIVDTLRMKSCLGRKTLLLPTLAKTSGMALVGLLSTTEDRTALRRLIKNDKSFRSALFLAAFIDLVSGMLLTGGILLTGGAIFVVLYNSCPAWTALLSKFFLGRSLTSKQTAGVLMVCGGLILNVFGTTEQLSSSHSGVTKVTIIGSFIVLLGCILHSAFFVLSDRSLRGHAKGSTSEGGNCHGHSGNDMNTVMITPPLWSSSLGSMEATVMSIYIFVSIYTKGFQPSDTDPEICSSSDFFKGFFTMLVVDCAHSAAFFLMIQKVGATGAALLKGIQSVAVVLLSAVFFCPKEEAQCLTTIKSFSVVFVLSGTFLYAAYSPLEEDQRRAKYNERENELPSIEVESLLDS